MSIDFGAMLFAKNAHDAQKRKYTNQPYFVHLMEVVGILSTTRTEPEILAIAWLHDVIEDTEFTYDDLQDRFGSFIADGVQYLTDSTEGNRKTRKEVDRNRIGKAPDYIQDIKLCDTISNTISIFDFDPNFSKLYGVEIRMLLDKLTNADFSLYTMADLQLKKFNY